MMQLDGCSLDETLSPLEDRQMFTSSIVAKSRTVTLHFVFTLSIANTTFHPFEQNRPFKFELSKRCHQQVFATMTDEEAKLGHKMLRKQYISR